jgi:hypothetical protein
MLLVAGMAVLALVATGCDDGGGGDDVMDVQDVQDQGTDQGTDPGSLPDCCGTDRGPEDPGPLDPGPLDPGPCVKTCGDRVCGASNCDGETCGECTAANTTCDTLKGICVPTCDWPTFKPTITWGPTGAISSLTTPADAAVVKSLCFDYTGDGLGDNGLKGLAGQVNGPLADAVSGGSIAILFELAGVTDFTTTASFQLNGLLGKSTATPAATTGDFQVQEASYVTDICTPMIYFEGASIADGKLAAGPSMFQLSIPISEGLVIDATLIQAKVKASITAGATADGFAATDGVLSGVLTKEQLEAAIAKLQASCDAAPANAKPDFCSYLKVAVSAMNLLFDLHQVIDDQGNLTFVAKTKDLPGDAASVCLSYSLSTAKVVGFEPVVTP